MKANVSTGKARMDCACRSAKIHTSVRRFDEVGLGSAGLHVEAKHARDAWGRQRGMVNDDSSNHHRTCNQHAKYGHGRDQLQVFQLESRRVSPLIGRAEQNLGRRLS